VGAAADADVVVSDPAVSRRHVELTLVPAGVRVRDLDSRNGTWHLGHRVHDMVLQAGGRIRIGGVTVEVAIDHEALDAVDGSATGYRGLVGDSAAMRKLFAVLGRLEGSLVNVLVEGASGVGKELVAQAIHQGSSRATQPLVTVNCGALSRELVLSELFGHRRGAFTGAQDERVGAFQAADGGTLFLDEIGELPLEIQPALLRVLESGEVKRLGDTATQRVSTRVVAATNRDLRQAVEEGKFREDLYFRLAVVKLRVPPLSERPEDVPRLAHHFATEAGAGPLPEDVIRSLAQRHFRGNARELRNAVQAYVAIGAMPESIRADKQVLERALRAVVDPHESFQEQKAALNDAFARVFFGKLLHEAGGNQSEAARIAGLDRSYMRKLMDKHKVRG
jgi:transcriptional regulator with GAF, ATPase, and Fis domain